MQPEPPPTGAMEAMQIASQNLKAVLGMYDPNQMPGVKSGKAINAEQQQTDTSNFHFYDNLTQSIAFAWRQGLDIMPKILDTERVMRIIGEDGRASLVTVNEGKDMGAALGAGEPSWKAAIAGLGTDMTSGLTTSAQTGYIMAALNSKMIREGLRELLESVPTDRAN